ncbi:MAG: histidine phosphatase family protein [Vicinamibacterales bacterium]
MRAILVHHAEAVDPGVDHMRPLSETGRRQAEAVAAALQGYGVAPVAVWHSGKLRARETAMACWRALNPLAPFTAVRGLQPSDGPDTIATALLAEDGDILLTGHMPHLPRLLHRLLTGRDDGGSAEFPLHGAMVLTRAEGGWRLDARVMASGDLLIG